MFEIHGHDSAVRTFQTGVSTGKLHHAYLIIGPPHVGKTTLATQIAQAVNCQRPEQAPCRECDACTRIASGGHADVRTIAVDPEAAEGPRTAIGIASVREVINSAHLQPYEGKMRVYIFYEAERLTPEAANAFLKVLEEPPDHVLMLLLADDIDRVLLTVVSRCQRIDLRPLPIADVATLLSTEYGVSTDQADVISRLSRGCLGWAIQATQDPALLAGVHQRLERISEVIGGQLEERFSYADELARRFQRDRAAGREELFQWLRWLRDILLVQQQREDDVVNISWRDTLHRQAAALTPAQAVRWLHLVTESIEALDRNANARLALDVLMLESPTPTGASA